MIVINGIDQFYKKLWLLTVRILLLLFYLYQSNSTPASAHPPYTEFKESPWGTGGREIRAKKNFQPKIILRRVLFLKNFLRLFQKDDAEYFVLDEVGFG